MLTECVTAPRRINATFSIDAACPGVDLEAGAVA